VTSTARLVVSASNPSTRTCENYSEQGVGEESQRKQEVGGEGEHTDKHQGHALHLHSYPPFELLLEQ